MSTSFIELVKIGLGAGAVVAVVVTFVMVKLGRSKDTADLVNERGCFKLGPLSFSARHVWLAVLLAYAGLSVISYYRFSPAAFFDQYDEYDILHYYLNAKYSDELGYDMLYPAVIVADSLTVNRFQGRITKYRHAADHSYRNREQAIAMAPEIKGLFNGRRWKEFVSDYHFLQGRIRDGTWKTILQDRGYNATPVWNMVGRTLSNLVPVEDLKILCLLDALLMIAMLVAVYWAFGAEALAFCLLFIGVSYSFRWPVVGWSVLRLDWMVALVSGAAFMKKERYKTAGILFGYATCMRIFPAVFMFGLVAKGIHGIVKNREIPVSRIWARVPRHYWVTAASMVLTMTVLVGAAIARDGTKPFLDNFEDLRVHMLPENLSSQRCGLGTALVFDNTTGTSKGYIPKAKKMEVGEKSTLKYIIAFVLLILLGIGAGRLEDHEAVLYGFIPFFLLSIASYYYYVMRMTAVAMHAERIDRPRNVLGLALLFSIEILVWSSELTMRSRYFAVGWMGWSLTFYSVLMIGILVWNWWQARKAEAE